MISLIAVSWASKAEAEKITILSGYDVLFMQGYIADKEGFFKDEGLDVDIKYTVSGKVAVDGVVSGAGVMGIGASLVAVTAATRAPINIIAPLGRSPRNMKLVALKGISGATDLKGKKIGFQFGTSGHRHTLAILAKHGMSAKDVTLMNIPAQGLPAALSRGDIDALSVWPPHSTKALAATPGSTALDDGYGVLVGMGLAVMRKDFIASDPASAGKLISALIKANDFMVKHPARTMQHFADQGKITLDLAKKIYADLKPNYDMSLDKEFMNEMQVSLDFLHDQGKIKKKVNATDVVYKKIMQAIAPERVTF
jgi:NitT/TauT family transport system substrate-binding protein